MKITDLEKPFGVFIKPLSYELNQLLDSSLSGKDFFDFNVYLPSAKRNLQRGFVWDLEQKRSFITSLFREIPVLPITIYNDCTINDGEIKAIRVIDGKQRISTIRAFVNNEFTIECEDGEFTFKDLPKSLQSRFLRKLTITTYVYTAIQPSDRLSEDFLISWFNTINHAGVKHSN